MQQYTTSVEKAREDVDFQARQFGPHQSEGPVSGTYNSSYSENGRTCKSTVYLAFETEPKSLSGWIVRGHGHDADGGFRVTEGRVAANGEAYWIEKQGSREVLNSGCFDFKSSTFCGQWLASNGVKSKFTYFKLLDGSSKTTAIAMPDSDRIVTATVYKESADQKTGISFRKGSSGEAVISLLSKEGMLAKSNLSLGWTVALINNEKVESHPDAVELIRSATGAVTIATIDGDPEQFHDLVTAAVEKEAGQSTGLSLTTKKGSIWIKSIGDTSMFRDTRLIPGTQIISINNERNFRNALDAAQLLRESSGCVTIAGRVSPAEAGGSSAAEVNIPMAEAVPISPEQSELRDVDITVSPYANVDKV